MKRKPKKLPPLYKFLDKHKPGCTYRVFSGDRHCSCGRDECLKVLETVRVLLGEEVALKVLGASG